MNGPYILTADKVDEVVTRTSPGAYILGNREKAARYVGRSDDDVRARLKSWASSSYWYFWFEYASSPKAAFELECTYWHRYGGAERKLDDKNHPARPAGSGWKCPVCTIFD
jgi:hypothetical protein